ncbi:MAG: hypothetical protein JNM28_00490 [Armatimonadetes bacterium]|nr:hypothetical protein [Armatimonadota bacterium]MBS1711329.1 hypothetical protein [Armatimonadota bacterium]MBX3107746.1 hypothetical protein [Fimbriimonadaceae bacterium]
MTRTHFLLRLVLATCLALGLIPAQAVANLCASAKPACHAAASCCGASKKCGCKVDSHPKQAAHADLAPAPPPLQVISIPEPAATVLKSAGIPPPIRFPEPKAHAPPGPSRSPGAPRAPPIDL